MGELVQLGLWTLAALGKTPIRPEFPPGPWKALRRFPQRQQARGASIHFERGMQRETWRRREPAPTPHDERPVDENGPGGPGPTVRPSSLSPTGRQSDKTA